MAKMIPNLAMSTRLLRPLSHLQNYSTVHPRASTSKNKSFNVAVKDAERVVGYPTSFLNLRWLLNDEFANVAHHLRKLVDMNHPFIETASDVIFKKDQVTWGLVVLLLSKVAATPNKIDDLEYDRVAGILHSQRFLAEVTEMVRTGVLLHGGVLNILPDSSEDAKELHVGNNFAILSGDYLFGKSFQDLALIADHDVNAMMSAALRDMTEYDFLGDKDHQNHPLPTRPLTCQADNDDDDDCFVANMGEGPFKVDEILGRPKREWYLRSVLNCGNLLAKSCKSTLILAKYSSKMQDVGFQFGRYMALAWQAKKDLRDFQNEDFGKYTLVSAPVMWCLSKYPELYDLAIDEACAHDVFACDFKAVHRFVSDKKDVLDECEQLNVKLRRKAIQYLDYFENSASKTALCKLVMSQ